MASVNRPLRVAIDNGYYDHKAAWFEGGKIKTLKYPAILGGASEAISDVAGGFADTYETEEGERFVVDADVESRIPIRNSDYGLSVANRVLVNHGLALAGSAKGQSVQLMTSLPVRDFFNEDGTLNSELVEGQKKNMLNPMFRVLNARDQPVSMARVVQSNVISEAVAAAFDYLIPEVGAEPDEIRAPIAVLDFGGSTFDIVTLTNKLRVRHSSSATMRRGTIDIVKPFKEALKQHLQELGIRIKEVPDWMASDAMINRTYKHMSRDLPPGLDSRELPVDGVINAAAQQVVSELRSFVTEKLSNFSEYQAILLVGGGSLLCRDLFQDWAEEPNFVLMDEFANARGMLKMASTEV